MNQSIIDRLSELAESNGGRLTPDIVVEDARVKGSPLHDCFEWNTKQAAYHYWRAQARQLIKSVKIEIRTETRKIRAVAYVRDPDCEKTEQGYVSIMQLKSETDKAREVIVSEFARASAALERAHSIAAVLDMTDEVSDAMEQVQYLHHRAIAFDGEIAH